MDRDQDLGITKVALSMVIGKPFQIGILLDHLDLILISIRSSVMMLSATICGQRLREKIFNMEVLT